MDEKETRKYFLPDNLSILFTSLFGIIGMIAFVTDKNNLRFLVLVLTIIATALHIICLRKSKKFVKEAKIKVKKEYYKKDKLLIGFSFICIGLEILNILVH